MGMMNASRGMAARGTVCVIVLAVAAACSVVSNYRIASSPAPAPIPHISLGPQWVNGVALPAMGDLKSWEKATGERPAVVAMFGLFGAPFPVPAIKRALMAGAVPLVQLDPSGISLAAIARGTYDPELRAYDAAVRSLNDPVLLSFGHEMNGVWYSWGCGQASPRLFRAAWRHIHALVSAPQVIWVWTINDIWNGDPCPLRPWYPGAAYVDWVGVDGYLRPSVNTFSSAFGRTLAVLHRLARNKPILLAETGVPWGPGWAQRLNSLYAGAHHAGLRGIVYFDGRTANGDYRPQDHPAALALFRRALRRWG